MLQKFNITAYAVVLCLFGFMLFSAAPVFANYDYGYGDMDVACKAIKDGSSTDDQIDECFTDIWDRASLSTFDSLADEHNSEIQQLKDEHAEELLEINEKHENYIAEIKDGASNNRTFESLEELCGLLEELREEHGWDVGRVGRGGLSYECN